MMDPIDDDERMDALTDAHITPAFQAIMREACGGGIIVGYAAVIRFVDGDGDRGTMMAYMPGQDPALTRGITDALAEDAATQYPGGGYGA